MAKIEDPSGLNILQIDPTYDAARVSLWPTDALGAYRYAGFTGLLTGLAANAEFFQFRWTDSVNLPLLKFVHVSYAVITGFTAAQEIAFDMQRATGWSAAGTLGTSVVPAANNLMRRTTYPISKVNELRIATTTALGVGTKTLTGSSDLVCTGKTLAAAATVQDAKIEATLDLTNSGDDPIIFLQNEGFVLRNSILMGAGGTIRATVAIGWNEILASDYPSL